MNTSNKIVCQAWGCFHRGVELSVAKSMVAAATAEPIDWRSFERVVGDGGRELGTGTDENVMEQTCSRHVPESLWLEHFGQNLMFKPAHKSLLRRIPL